LATCHPIIVLSVHPRHLKLLGESETTLRQVIDELGYTISDMSGCSAETFELREYILEPVKLRERPVESLKS